MSAGDFVSAADIAAGLCGTTAPRRQRHTITIARADARDFSCTPPVRDNGGTANGGVDLDATPNNDHHRRHRRRSRLGTVRGDCMRANRTVTVLGTPATPSPPPISVSAIPTTTRRTPCSRSGFPSLPSAGSLRLDGRSIAVGEFVGIAELTQGKLSFSPAANANGSAYASFGFQVRDDGGVANGGVDLDPTIRTISFDVGAVNDAPTLSGPGRQIVRSGEGFGPLVLNLGDEETEASDLSVRAYSTNQAVLPDSAIQLSGAGAERSLTVQAGYTGVPGIARIVIEVSDGSETVSMAVEVFASTVAPPEAVSPRPPKRPRQRAIRRRTNRPGSRRSPGAGAGNRPTDFCDAAFGCGAGRRATGVPGEQRRAHPTRSARPLSAVSRSRRFTSGRPRCSASSMRRRRFRRANRRKRDKPQHARSPSRTGLQSIARHGQRRAAAPGRRSRWPSPPAPASRSATLPG